MGVASASIPLLLIAPAYAPIPQIPVGQWSPPADAVPINMREPWKEEVCLVLWLSSPTWNLDGTTVTIDLAWQTLCSISGYWSTFVHFSDLSLEICEAGDTRHILSQYDSMPGGGNLPLPAFRPGYVVQETISLAPPDEIDRSRSWHLQLGLYDAGGTFVRTAVEVDDGSRSSGIGARKCASDTVNVILP
jgi:hypothetical protein